MGSYVSTMDRQSSQSGRAAASGERSSGEPKGSEGNEQIEKVAQTFVEEAGKVARSFFGGQRSQPAHPPAGRAPVQQSGVQLDAAILGAIAVGGIAYAFMERSGSESSSSE